MTFVTPSLLLGALLVAVPVVLHLIMRQRPKRVRFPAMQFLHQRHEANRRRLRLRHLLLLLLRCAAIALLAMALARPSIQGAGMRGGGEGPVAAAFIFDTSPRMEYQHHNVARLEAAKELALWLAAQLPSESQVAVLEAASGASAYSVDLAAARQQIRRVATSPVVRPLPDVMADAVQRLTEAEQPRKEIYVFTDLARGSWPRSAADRLRADLERLPSAQVYLIDVGVEEPVNFGLGDLRLSAQRLAADGTLQLSADLYRSGEVEDRPVELFVRGPASELEKRGQNVYTWQPDAAQQAEFSVRLPSDGTYQGHIRVAGEDSMAADNVRYFTVHVEPPPKVLIAAADPDDAVYLTEAIAPRDLPEGASAGFVADVEVIRFEALAGRDFSETAVVCLLDPPPLAAPVWQRLGDFAEQGGGVGIFLGRRAVPVEEMNGPVPQELLPGELKRQWREDTHLAPDAYQHPVLAKFQPFATEVPWKSFPVYKYWQLDEPAGAATVLLRYATGHPALLEKPLGEGRVLTMTTPISDPAFRADRWNLLPTGFEPWPYVILASETVAYLADSGQTPLNYAAGEAARLPLPRDNQAEMFLLTRPASEPVRQTIDLAQRAVIVRATDVLGNYRVQAGGMVSGLDLGFSVNLPEDTTRLDRLEKADLDAMLGEDRYSIARNRDQVDREVNVGRVGTELFPYLILLVAAALLAEHVVANRFYKSAP